jgi:DNA-binding transcriptional LysR family regulator
MNRDELGDLLAFVAVAEECNFTQAAARLGISQSALSHTGRRLEERLGVTLLDRTTRSVTPTEAGSRVARSLCPSFDDILASVSALDELRDKPAGTVRLTTSSHAAETVRWPTVSRLLVDNPELNVEISVDQKRVDIGTGRFDAGVRLGEQVSEGELLPWNYPVE